MAGTGYYWGGIPLLAERVQAERTLGFDPDVATFRMHESAFREWIADLDPDRFDRHAFSLSTLELPLLVVQLGELIPAAPPQPGEKPPLVEDLALIEIDNAGTEHRVEYVAMFLADVRILEDTQPRLVEVGLTDIRKFWSTHGTVTRNFNLRLPDGSVDQATLNDTIPNSEPVPWTIGAILDFLIERLPGSPELVEAPLITGAVVRPIRAWGARPVEILRSILADFLLVFSYNLDATVSIFQQGRGRIGEVDEGAPSFQTRDHDPVTKEGVWAGQVLRDSFIRKPNLSAETEVEVIGNRRIYSTSIDYWQPVVIIDVSLPAGGRGQRVIDITLESLRRIAAGEFPVAEAELEPLEGELTDVELRTFLRLPFTGAAWPLPLKDVQPESRTLLKRQLFRIWRIPDEFRHLLPLLDRAEFIRDPGGSKTDAREAVSAEAFGFESEALDLVGELGSRARTEDEIAYQVKVERVAVIDATLAQLKDLALQDLKEFAVGVVTGDIGRAEGAPSRVAIAGTEFSFEAPIIDQVVEFFNRSLEDVNEFWRRPVREYVSDLVGADAPEAEIAAERAVLEAEKQGLQNEIIALLAKINPERAVTATIIQLEDQIRRQTIAGNGVTPLALVTQRRQLIGQRDQIIENKRAAADKLPRRKHLHANRGRRPVEIRVLSRQRGIIEIVGPLPGWLADPYVATQEAAIFVPMPVRVTFGTSNSAAGSGVVQPEEEPDTPPNALEDNEWTQRLQGVFRESIPEMQFMLQDTGHVFPAVSGSNQTRFTFTRDDRESGNAEIGPFPFSAIFAELREFIGLPTEDLVNGDRNTEELLGQAAAIAGAILAEDEAQDSGTLEIRFPRRVNPTGRVTAVRHRSRPGGKGVNTTISFDNAVAPLPGVLRARRVLGRVQETFGIPVDAFE